MRGCLKNNITARAIKPKQQPNQITHRQPGKTRAEFWLYFHHRPPRITSAGLGEVFWTIFPLPGRTDHPNKSQSCIRTLGRIGHQHHFLWTQRWVWRHANLLDECALISVSINLRKSQNMPQPVFRPGRIQNVTFHPLKRRLWPKGLWNMILFQ